MSNGFKHTFIRPASFLLLGALIALTGWSGHELALPIILLFPFAFGLTAKRVEAFTLSIGYMLAMSRGLVEGSSAFFNSGLTLGIGLWFAGALVFTTVYTFSWRSSSKGKLCGFMIAMTLLSIPPLGIVAWGSPMTAAGIIFPSFGFSGLALTIIAIGALIHKKTRLITMPVMVICSTLGIVFGLPAGPPKDWTGAETSISYQAGIADFDKSFKMLQAARKIISESEAKVIVFPEGAAGWRTVTVEREWVKLAKRYDKIIIVGYEQNQEYGFDNAAAIITADGFQSAYRQRMPVPISMWRPWAEKGTRAFWFEQPTVQIDGKSAAILICYEQLLIWPTLQSVANRPELIIGIANDWWAAETSIPAIQRTTMRAWARLFNLDLVESFNL